MAAFGSEIPKALDPLLEKAGMSQEKFQAWGKAVAEGGADGAKAMSEMVTWLSEIEDGTLKNDIASEIFRSKWEDQGQNMVAVFQGLSDAQDKTAENTNELKDAIDTMDENPIVRIKDAFSKIIDALRPALLSVAEFVGKLADWAAENPKLTATIVAIGTVLGILVGAFALLMPAVGGLITAWPILAAAFGAISAPVLAIVAAVGLLVGAFVLAYNKSESFRELVGGVFSKIKEVAVTAFETVASFIKEKIDQIKAFWESDGEQILQAVQNIFQGIMAVIEFVMPFVLALIQGTWEAIKNVIDGALNIIMGLVQVFSGLFTGDFSKMWEGLKQIFSGAVEAIWGILQLGFLGKIFKIVKKFGEDAFEKITEFAKNIKTKFGEIVENATTKFTEVRDAIMNPVVKAKEKVSEVIEEIKGFFSNLKLKLPEISLPKLPRFTITGDWGLNPPRAPKIGVNFAPSCSDAA